MATHSTRTIVMTCDHCGKEIKHGDLIRVSRVVYLPNGLEVDQDLLEVCLTCGAGMLNKSDPERKTVAFTEHGESEDA